MNQVNYQVTNNRTLSVIYGLPIAGSSTPVAMKDVGEPSLQSLCDIGRAIISNDEEDIYWNWIHDRLVPSMLVHPWYWCERELATFLSSIASAELTLGVLHYIFEKSGDYLARTGGSGVVILEVVPWKLLLSFAVLSVSSTTMSFLRILSGSGTPSDLQIYSPYNYDVEGFSFEESSDASFIYSKTIDLVPETVEMMGLNRIVHVVSPPRKYKLKWFPAIVHSKAIDEVYQRECEDAPIPYSALESTLLVTKLAEKVGRKALSKMLRVLRTVKESDGHYGCGRRTRVFADTIEMYLRVR